MKAIVILITLVIFFAIPTITLAGAQCDYPKPIIIKNELPPCIKIQEYTCMGGIELKNECEEDAYYTNLKCDWGSRESHENNGFKVVNNEVTVSKKVFSFPSVLNDIGYHGRINYAGGAWLPCKEKSSFYNKYNKQVTVNIRIGSQNYQIVGYLPYGPTKIGILDKYAIWLGLSGLMSVICAILVKKAINKKINKKITSNHIKNNSTNN